MVLYCFNLLCVLVRIFLMYMLMSTRGDLEFDFIVLLSECVCGVCRCSLTVPVVSRCGTLSQPVQTSVQSVLDPVLRAGGVLHLHHSGSAGWSNTGVFRLHTLKKPDTNKIELLVMSIIVFSLCLFKGLQHKKKHLASLIKTVQRPAHFLNILLC